MVDSLPLHELLGRTIRYRGQDWTVAVGFDGRPCLQQRLSTAAFETLLAAMREGALLMSGDGSEYRSASIPATRSAIECEMQIHEAMLEGHRHHKTLSAEQVVALQTRLALLRAALADFEVDGLDP